jgi:hypothetical protein
MRPPLVIIGQKVFQQVPQVLLPTYQEVIPTLLPYTLHPAFRVSIQVRGQRSQPFHLHPIDFQHSIELLDILAIVVDEQVRRRMDCSAKCSPAFRAICVTHALSGCAVTPAINTRRLSTCLKEAS